MSLTGSDINKISTVSGDRFNLWISLINHLDCQNMLEIGVYAGEFASQILSGCKLLVKYYMLDPWKNLDDWNKPSNNVDFDIVYNAMLLNTSFAESKRIILRGKTTEMIDDIDDESLDFIYIDGDHTLKGITIDLNNAWRKLKPDGIIGGDDFTPSIWQHEKKFEPSFVFPYAVYFAQSVGAEIYALSFNQFLIKKAKTGYKFYDLTGKYSDITVRNQIT